MIDNVSPHFKWREFVPDEAHIERLGEGEKYMTHRFANSVMEPLRIALGVPMEINGYGRTQAGWRWNTLGGPGAAGISSDHMAMENPACFSSLGAVDLLSRKCSSKKIFQTLADLAEVGEIPYPREIIYERKVAGISEVSWVHVSFPETFKQHYGYRELRLPIGKSNVKQPRKMDGTPHRLWTIVIDSNGAQRMPVDTMGDVLE
jgi:hypothetical protein